MTTKKELLEIAKQKASKLQPNQQIRLTAEEKSYWVFNFGGLLFIGSLSDQPLPKFFENRGEYVMSDKDGKKVGMLQRLM
jgi:hypothetical protein